MGIRDDFATAAGVVEWDKADAEARRLYDLYLEDGPDPDPDPADVSWVLTDLHVEHIEVLDGTLVVRGSVANVVPGIQRVGDSLSSDMTRLFAERGVTTIEKDEVAEVIAELESGILAPWVMDESLVKAEVSSRLRASGFTEKYGVEKIDLLGLFVEERALSTGVEPFERIQQRLQHDLDLLRSEQYRAAAVRAGLSDEEALRMWREGIPVEFAVAVIED